MTVASLLGSRELPPAFGRTGVIVVLIGVGLWCLYTLVFAIAMAVPASIAMRAAAANVLPLIGLATATRHLLRTQAPPETLVVKAARHVAYAIAFAVFWYGAILILSAVLRGIAGRGFVVQGFSEIALAWQVFQGFAIYAVVAVTASASWPRSVDAERASADDRPLRRYLTKAGKIIRPVKVDEIVMIAGAHDYSEVTTHQGRHLVRLSLGEFERRLDPDQFFRVHRSALINLEHLERLEPSAGGRMIAHLSTGESVEVSRSGAQLLRSFMV